MAACCFLFAASSCENSGSKAFTITLYWQESNVVGKKECPKVTIKNYSIAALD